MPTTLVGTAYRIEGVELGSNDIISAGTSLTAVELRTVDPDANDFIVTPRSVIFEGTVNETVLSEAEAISFFADGIEIATQSPSYEFVSLQTNVGTIFGITFFAGGDTYFLPRNDFPADGLTDVTADSQIRANNVAFNQLDFGLVPPGTTQFEGLVFGSGSIDAPGLGVTRLVIDSDDTVLNPDDSTEISVFNAAVLVTVTFDDGSSISGVRAYQSGDISFVNNQTIDTRAFAIDVAAVEATGRTLDNVVDADFESFTSHNLTYAEIGFEPLGTTPGDDPAPTPDPIPDPDPIPEPEVTVIEGTSGDDRLRGTDGDDIIIGGAGSDKLTGSDGADTFIFGADTGDGSRDRDVITDFNIDEDLIVLEQGAEILRLIERGGDLRIVLDGGDRDVIVIRDADESVVDNIVFATDDFIA
ncbi:hypothetical protein [Actibacterium ureilyticum]|uniref:hypothetical protein n=1 Tax=Actibacterium ureilyticum TaxID=1590614 RepID=UPI0011411061|nr:hypothetical protein [Actibacterium ureilyticum]